MIKGTKSQSAKEGNQILELILNLNKLPQVNTKTDTRSTIYACQFRRYRYASLPFGASPTGDIFQRNVDKNFKEMSNGFGIADDIQIVGYDRDHTDCDATIQRVLKISKRENLILNIDR